VQIFSKSSPPAAYSITMARCVGVKQTCYQLICRTNCELVKQFDLNMINGSMFENGPTRLILKNKLGCLWNKLLWLPVDIVMDYGSARSCANTGFSAAFSPGIRRRAAYFLLRRWRFNAAN
jgi:hypothetical protein